MLFDGVGQAVEVAFAALVRVETGGRRVPRPGQQRGERFRLIEKSVAVGGENLAVGRDGAFGAAIGGGGRKVDK